MIWTNCLRSTPVKPPPASLNLIVRWYSCTNWMFQVP